MAKLNEREQNLLLKRGVIEIISEAELITLLESGKKLRFKQGFDPSRPDIHLGHVVGLRKLRQFQERGHQVVLIVGDWTAQIGDPSGVSTTRTMLSAEEVQSNAQTYMKQFFKVIDKDKTEVRFQSEWFGKFGLADIIKLTSKFTVAQFLAREDFAQRYSAGRPIAITELLYPLLQGYDSVAIKSDVEFGGTDQKFNCLVGRDLQQIMGMSQQQVFLMPLLVGTDGTQKMSKSLGNYIGIDEPPNDIYGKVMSIPDRLILDYFELLTDTSTEEIAEFKHSMSQGSVNPMVLKKRLARDIVTQFHSAQDADEAEDHFTRIFQKRETPDEVISLAALLGMSATMTHKHTKAGAIDNPTEEKYLLTIALAKAGLTKSRAEAKQLLAQGAIEIDGEKATEDIDISTLGPGHKIKVGKRRFAST